MKRKIAVLLAGCFLSMAAVAPSFAESGAAASPKAGGATDVLGSLYTHISENVKAEAPSLQARPVQLTPQQGKELLAAMAEKAVKEHPDRFEAYVFRGSMYYMKGEKEKCFADLDHAVSLAPENPLSYGSRAEFYARDGRDKAALRDWDKALSLHPADEVKDEIYFQRALFHMARKQNEEAVSDFKEDLKYIHPKLRFAVHISMGDCYSRLGNKEEAEKCYREAVKERPDHPVCWLALGDFYSDNLKKYDKAESCYDKAIALYPRSALFLRSAGLNALKMKRNEKALDYFTKSIAASPSYWQGYSLRGSTYALMEKYEPAAADFTKAMELKKEPDALLLTLRGDCYNKLGLNDKAVEDYTKAVELDPKNADAFESMGYIYSLKGENDKAIPYYEKAIALHPKKGEAYNNLGYTWFQKGNTNKALEYLNKAIEVDPNYAESYRSRAEVYESMGEYHKALADMDRFTVLSPKDARGREFRDQLAKKSKGS